MKAVILTILLCITCNVIAQNPSCQSPKVSKELSKATINKCVKSFFESVMNNTETERINISYFKENAAKIIFTYGDIDRSGSLNFKELVDVMRLYSDNKNLTEKLYISELEASFAVYEEGNSRKDVLEELGFRPDPPVESFLAALKTNKSLYKKLNVEGAYDLADLTDDGVLSGIIAITEEIWKENFNVTVKDTNKYVSTINGYDKFNEIVKAENRKQIQKKYYDSQNIKKGVILNQSKNDWFTLMSIGDKFESVFTKDFSNPAKLSFKDSAGEETKESLNLALRFDIDNIKKDEWIYSFGYSIEKSNEKENATDIRAYHYSQSKKLEKFGIQRFQLGLSEQDNFESGYEAWVGRFTFLPKLTPHNKCGTKKYPSTWLDFSGNDCNEITTSEWQFFYTPLFGVELNELKQRPSDLEIVVNDDEHYVFAELQTGLRKGSYEVTYSNFRRYNISGGKHLSYQTLDLEYYFDKAKRFSIGIKGKLGQRPVDIEKVEDYELSFGFRL